MYYILIETMLNGAVTVGELVSLVEAPNYDSAVKIVKDQFKIKDLKLESPFQ